MMMRFSNAHARLRWEPGASSACARNPLSGVNCCARLCAHPRFWPHENKKKDLNNSLYQNHLGLKAKDGIRTRDIHLGKVDVIFSLTLPIFP